MSSKNNNALPHPCRLCDMLPQFYLVACIPFGLLYCFLVPPLLVPDEWAHFFRTVQISYGDVIGEKPEGSLPGGQVPDALRTFRADPRFPKRPQSNKASRTTPVTQGNPPAISRLRLNEETKFHACPFVRYPPSSYLFGATAVRLGRAWQLDVVSIFYLARLFTFVTSAFMAWLALCWISSGRLFAFFVLSTPMVLSLFASCSQDAALIAFTGLSAGFVQRFLMPTADASPRGRSQPLFWASLAVSAGMGAVAAGRPPYLPLAGVVPLFYYAKTRRWVEAGILGSVVIAVMLAWLWATRELGSGNEFGSDHAGQVQFILAHPLESLAVFFRTVWNYTMTSSYLRRLVADTQNGGPLPSAIYMTAGITLAVTLARDVWWARNTTNLATRILSFILVCGAFFAIHLACYIYFTPVGEEIARGNIGRYLVPMLLTLTLALGRAPSRLPGPTSRQAACLLDSGSIAFAITVVVVANVASAIAIMRTFYYP